jgi:3-hydroxy-5-methyl-1-naphthoate 3-O-methyltransferase
MEMASGLWVTKVLATALELGVFEVLAAHGPLTSSELAHRLDLPARSTGMLLTGCASLGLLEKDAGQFSNSALAAEYLVSGCRYYFGDLVRLFEARTHRGWMSLADAVRRNQPTTWNVGGSDSLFDQMTPADAEVFWSGMYSLSAYTACRLGEAHDLSRARRLLDVGGGGGAFAIELCRRYPALHVTIYDRPSVCAATTARIEKAGLSDRIATVGGDFFADTDLPGSHDVVLLASVLHDWSEEQDLVILRKCHAALEGGGTLLISELLLDDAGTGQVPAALMNLTMLIETKNGANYTESQYHKWLAEIGFTGLATIPFTAPGANAVVIGHKA